MSDCCPELPNDLQVTFTHDPVLEQLRWKKFPVLDDGFVCLVDAMGSDAAIVQAARVSYGNDVRNETEEPGEAYSTQFKEKAQTGNRQLIRYLMRHRHSTPFEMAEVKLLVRVPMDTWRQWIRHRTANVNEYSTRYAEAIDAAQKTPPDKWRLQSGSNKQGSDGFLHEWEPSHASIKQDNEEFATPGELLSNNETHFQGMAREIYLERLKLGVAREQARKDLPLSTYTEAYWKCDLHNILHFLGLRMDSHAQAEIREYATTIGEQIIKPLFPVVWEAFEDYRLGAMTLSRLDILMIERMSTANKTADMKIIYDTQCGERPFKENGWDKESNRERNECKSKLERMGLL